MSPPSADDGTGADQDAPLAQRGGWLAQHLRYYVLLLDLRGRGLALVWAVLVLIWRVDGKCQHDLAQRWR